MRSSNIPAEILQFKTKALDSMVSYMSMGQLAHVDVSFDAKAGLAQLRSLFEELLLPSAWEKAHNVVNCIKCLVFRMAFYTSAPYWATEEEAERPTTPFTTYAQECVDIFLKDILRPEAQQDLPRVLQAVFAAQRLALQFSFEGLEETAYRPSLANFDAGYTQVHIGQCDVALSRYLDQLFAAANPPNTTQIMEYVEELILCLNELNEGCGNSLIETDQREDLCHLIARAAQQAGLPATDIDITEAWREW